MLRYQLTSMHQRGQYLPERHAFKAHTEALILFFTAGT